MYTMMEDNSTHVYVIYSSAQNQAVTRNDCTVNCIYIKVSQEWAYEWITSLQHVYLKISTVFQLTIKMFLIMSCNLSFTGEERGIYKHAFRSILYGSCVLVFSSSCTTRSYFRNSFEVAMVVFVVITIPVSLLATITTIYKNKPTCFKR